MGRKREKELSMRKIREILRLGMECHMGAREIGRSCSVSPGTVGKYLGMVQKAGLSCVEIDRMSDGDLVKKLQNPDSSVSISSRPTPDWGHIHDELKKKGVTIHLLWEEYKESHPGGYQSSQFYEHYNRWRKKLKVSLRQNHKAGEKLFVDYAGQTIPITDSLTGKIRQAQIFVSVLGASNYTYVEATWTQSLPDWIGSHVRAFEYFGGVPHIVVPDNLKSGVSKSCRYEPDINPSYHDMSVHYGTAIIPARVRKPQDKAKAEAGVLLTERWILAVLRNMSFFTLFELNTVIGELRKKLNTKPFQKLPGSRQSSFETVEREALLPLPESRYVFCQWKKVKANIDYHVELNRHYYSVPYQLVQEYLEMRYTESTVEIFNCGKRVASHVRKEAPGKHTTLKEHMPLSHQTYLEWNPSRIIRWAGTIGVSTSSVVERIMNSRKHPEQGYRSCMGIMRLKKIYSDQRLEAACKRALSIGGISYKSVRSILEKGLDLQPVSNPEPDIAINHENIRGPQYFN
jgi:transposase